MKNNGFVTILQCALGLSLLLTVIFCVKSMVRAREVRNLNGQVSMANAYRNTVQMVAADCIEYSKTHSAILPVLESVGLIGKVAAPAAKSTAK